MIRPVIIWGAIAVFLVSMGICFFNDYFISRKRLSLVLGWVTSVLCFIPTAIFMLYFIIKNLP